MFMIGPVRIFNLRFGSIFSRHHKTTGMAVRHDRIASHSQLEAQCHFLICVIILGSFELAPKEFVGLLLIERSSALDETQIVGRLFTLWTLANLSQVKIAFRITLPLQMSISLEAIFAAVAILVALPPAIVVTMRFIASRRRQHILPVVRAHEGEISGHSSLQESC